MCKGKYLYAYGWMCIGRERVKEETNMNGREQQQMKSVIQVIEIFNQIYLHLYFWKLLQGTLQDSFT